MYMYASFSFRYMFFETIQGIKYAETYVHLKRKKCIKEKNRSIKLKMLKH